jgi:hypothetical protein
MVRTEAEDSATPAMFDRNFRSDGYVATAIAAHRITTRLMILGVAGSRLMAKLVSIWEGLSHDLKRPTVSVVIPALNEERNLPHVAARMPHDIDEIVFVNGVSLTRQPKWLASSGTECALCRLGQCARFRCANPLRRFSSPCGVQSPLPRRTLRSN